MVRWYRDLYMDDQVKKKPDDYKKRVIRSISPRWRKFPFQKKCHILLLSPNPENLFEIMDTGQFFFRRVIRMNTVYVVGLAADYSGAVSLVQKIAEQLCKSGADCNLRSFFEKDDFE